LDFKEVIMPIIANSVIGFISRLEKLLEYKSPKNEIEEVA